MEKVVLGIVDTPEQATSTVERLEGMGFDASEISLLYPDRHGSHDFGFEQHSKAPEGALAGVGVGAVIGAGLGTAVGLGLLAIPGLGALVAAGPLLAALSGAATVAAASGLVGGLIGLGVPEIQAKHYAGKVKTGGILIGIHVDDRMGMARARGVLKSMAAHDVTETGEAALPPGARA